MGAIHAERWRTLRSVIVGLLQAHEYADECGGDAWQFAVELDGLTAGGALLTDIRYFLQKGWIEHAKEMTIPGDERRSFRKLAPTCFPAETCVLVTAEGAQVFRAAIDDASPAVSPSHCPQPGEHVSVLSSDNRVNIPSYDRARRELYYGDRLVKRFRRPARNQEMIVVAFDEIGWTPPVIDDPLPPRGDMDPKQRLRATVVSLNRGHLFRAITFRLNGHGTQVYWQAEAERAQRRRHRTRR